MKTFLFIKWFSMREGLKKEGILHGWGKGQKAKRWEIPFFNHFLRFCPFFVWVIECINCSIFVKVHTLMWYIAQYDKKYWAIIRWSFTFSLILNDLKRDYKLSEIGNSWRVFCQVTTGYQSLDPRVNKQKICFYNFVCSTTLCQYSTGLVTLIWFILKDGKSCDWSVHTQQDL